MNLTISNWYLLWIFSIYTKSHLPGFGVTGYSKLLYIVSKQGSVIYKYRITAWLSETIENGMRGLLFSVMSIWTKQVSILSTVSNYCLVCLLIYEHLLPLSLDMWSVYRRGIMFSKDTMTCTIYNMLEYIINRTQLLLVNSTQGNKSPVCLRFWRIRDTLLPYFCVFFSPPFYTFLLFFFSHILLQYTKILF